MDWSNAKDIISAIGVLFAIIMSLITLLQSRASKHTAILKELTDRIDQLEDEQTAHALKDEHALTKLNTEVDNLKDITNNKLSEIIRKLD